MSYEFYISPIDIETANKNGISNHTLEQRVRILAWPKQKAITTPTKPQKSIKTWVKLAEQHGIKYQTLRKRINELNWEPERAATQPLLDRAEAMRQVRKMRKYESRMRA